MPQIENPSPAAQPASTTHTAPATQSACCAVCRPQQHWWHSYRDVLLSTEALAALLGFASLAAGWVTASMGIHLSRWFYLASAVVSGLPILRSCWESLRERRISVEVLVALAILAALAVGEFHAGAVVAVMLLGGGVLEQITIARARRSLAALLVNMPETALVRRDGKEVEVPASELRVGDRVVTRPGERLAVDGC